MEELENQVKDKSQLEIALSNSEKQKSIIEEKLRNVLHQNSTTQQDLQELKNELVNLQAKQSATEKAAAVEVNAAIHTVIQECLK